MAAALSETRETLLKPSPKDAGATSQPQYHSPKPGGMKTSPPTGEVSPRFGGTEALRRFRGVQEEEEKGK
jgi:hypothetical protein